MALTNRALIRVPPDGAGKALFAKHLRYIEYHTAVGTDAFEVDDIVTGSSSSAVARVIYIMATNANSGAIAVAFNELDEIDVDFVAGESLQVGGQARAVVSSQEELYVSKTEIVGSNNDAHGQHVDNRGAASVRFTEGTPNFDAAGRTQSSEQQWIGRYPLTYDGMPDLIQTFVENGGSETYEASSSTMRMILDGQAGGSVVRQTHLHHPYQPGIAQNVDLTVRPGPSNGAVRRWGYFDERDGLFFEWDGQEMCVVVRSSASGSVVEHRVHQEQWNGDRLDGSAGPNNTSSYKFDPGLFALFNIGFLYLGAGPVKFSMYVGQERVTLHTFSAGAFGSRPFMRSGKLPLRWEISNADALGGSVEMRVGNSTVSCEGSFHPQQVLYGTSFRPPLLIDSTPRAALVFRPKREVFGQENRSIAFPTGGILWSADEPVYLEVRYGGEYGPITTWASENAESVMESAVYLTDPPNPASQAPIDIIEGGTVKFSRIIAPATDRYIELSHVFDSRSDGEIRRYADIDEYPMYALVLRSLGGPTEVSYSVNWREIL